MRWDLVGHRSHPIPDDPAVVSAQAQRLRAVAASMRTQIDRMPTEQHAGSLVWDSAAAEGFKTVVAQLPRDLGKLEQRYERVAGALDTFHTVLSRTKGEAEAAVQRAEVAHQAAEVARAGIGRMEDHARSAAAAADRINASAEPGTPPVSPEPWSGPDHRAALRTAEADLAKAVQDVNEAVGAFDRAAGDAAEAVARAADDDLKNDTSVWGSIKRGASWVVDRLPVEEIANLASSVAAVAGVIALLPIPFLQPLAAGIAIGASVVAFVATGALMLDKAHHGVPVTLGDWGNLGLAAVGFVGGAASRVAVGAVRSARGATAVARTGLASANHTVRVTTAARGVAQTRHLQQVTRLQGIQRSNIVVRGISRVTGHTGRVTERVARTGQVLDDALVAERSARTAQAVAQSRVTMAQAQQARAELTELGLRTANGTIDGAQTVRITQDPRLGPEVGNPLEAIYESVSLDVRGVLDGPGNPILDGGTQAGAAIPAEPIAAP